MTILSVRQEPHYAQQAIQYFQQQWANEKSAMVYEDCIISCLNSNSLLPQWNLLFDDERSIGCAGLVTNDFISRMDLYPWLYALYIDEAYRGRNLGALLIALVKEDAKKSGFHHLYLATDHIGYYEHYSFAYLAHGYHPWGKSVRIYHCKL